MKLPVPKEEHFKAPAHDERVTSKIGLALAVTFTTCFVTGLISHLIQHPPEWFFWPSRPAGLYRVTQGLHVISGIASIPLLLAKLWSVYPKLFGRPLVRSLPHALERLSILVLSGSAFFELTTGLLNVAQNYPWGFYFPQVHYAVAWLAIGSILVHVAVKLPVIRRALSRAGAEEPPAAGLSRRGFLRTTGLATGAAVVATAGATVPFLRGISGLSWKTANGTQGLPVNRTAAAAGITRPADWRLSVVTPRGTTKLSLDELRALPQTTAELPIACVEGWSQSATWRGISLPALLKHVGAAPGTAVRVSSSERSGLYNVSVLPGEHTADELTLLALELNGEELDLDHGFPCRIIAPNRPGVLQTKWVTKLEAL
ncbi:molybdopterin-dependent oxidoreductase [Amycolatopsis sp. OK19-0408]|uniref:Molybdopterin-dependent oxidoreductase n=1 Tax=Amycolatopsis iheyensis TaxID=2945988 RepID=A0A9X2N849_9PSEU|nr:molybdopterin-dependent oxidoreductase [Amycolatopsis iheyensis]MCR6484066.1 molybdopterin-dependent oxidoreductase [Amycolatopsis iheyensis]